MLCCDTARGRHSRRLSCLSSHVLRAYCNFESKQANSITLFGRRPNKNSRTTLYMILIYIICLNIPDQWAMWRWSCSVQIICWLEESFSVRFHIKNHISAFFALVLHSSFYFIYFLQTHYDSAASFEWKDSDWYIRLVYCFLAPASVEISSIPLTALLQKNIPCFS